MYNTQPISQVCCDENKTTNCTQCDKNKGKGTFRNYVQDFLDNRQDRDYNINEE